MTRRGLPPFKTRRSHKDLGNFATVRGFAPVPIYTSINNIWVDDINLDGCKYPLDVESHKRSPSQLKKTYGKQQYLIDKLRHVYKAELNLTDARANNISFHDAFEWSDYIISSLF